MADHHVSLSEIARDPIVAAFLARGERDTGAAFAVPAPKSPVLNDGAAAKVLEAA